MPVTFAADDEESSSDTSSGKSHTTTRALPKPLPVVKSASHQPPHIHIPTHPWDGTRSSQQTFINQLRAYAYFHRHSLTNDTERLIWAMSLLTGDAAAAVASYLDHLVKYAMDPDHLEEWREEDKKAPMSWRGFLEWYTEDICVDVSKARKQGEERWGGERWGGWIGGVFRVIWRAACFVVGWASRCVMFVLVVRCLVGVFGVETRGAGIVWEGEAGAVPNRGHFVVKE